MIYIKYIFLAICGILSDFLNYFLAPIVVLFATEDGWLPSKLSWFQTPDYSIDGDDGYKNEHRPFKVEDTKFKRYINRVRWLYRNSMYGFAIDVLGAKTLPTDEIQIIGETKVSNRPLHNGLVKRYIIRDNKVIYFQWYYVNAWSDTMCIRINFGWKLWSYKKGEATNCQLVFSPNPFMGYSNPT